MVSAAVTAAHPRHLTTQDGDSETDPTITPSSFYHQPIPSLCAFLPYVVWSPILCNTGALPWSRPGSLSLRKALEG